MFIWDYILTFQMEVDLVWKSKWTLMKGLYLFQRYLPFIDTVWLVVYCQLYILHRFNLIYFVDQTGGSFTKTACWKMYYASGGQ